ncbi:MAG TPA: hypothetical protein VF261_01135 [Candidatus Saccharimonadales bacterium]
MDFSNRNPQSQPGQPAAPLQQQTASSSVRGSSGRTQRIRGSKWGRIGSIILLFCVVILVAGFVAVLIFGNGDQSRFIKSNKYQAVFLTNGQVYFGHIEGMGGNYIRLGNIYYLTQDNASATSSSSSANSNYTLVKLGCQQIHDPYDEMIINRSQVSFWENLQDSGKVVQSIQQFQKQNPNGPDCSQVSSQTQASTGADAQGSGNNTPSSSANSSSNGSKTPSTTTKP